MLRDLQKNYKINWTLFVRFMIEGSQKTDLGVLPSPHKKLKLPTGLWCKSVEPLQLNCKLQPTLKTNCVEKLWQNITHIHHKYIFAFSPFCFSMKTNQITKKCLVAALSIVSIQFIYFMLEHFIEWLMMQAHRYEQYQQCSCHDEIGTTKWNDWKEFGEIAPYSWLIPGHSETNIMPKFFKKSLRW